MIYIVEIPHRSSPNVWCRHSKDEIMQVIHENSCKTGNIIYQELTGHELLESFDYLSIHEFRQEIKNCKYLEYFDYVPDLLEKHGLNTTYYMGFEKNHADHVGIEPKDEWKCFLDFNARDLQNQLVFMSDEEVKKALNNGEMWCIHQGIQAYNALKREYEFFNS